MSARSFLGNQSYGTSSAVTFDPGNTMDLIPKFDNQYSLGSSVGNKWKTLYAYVGSFVTGVTTGTLAASGNATVGGTLGVTGALTAASFSGAGNTAAPHPNGATVTGTLAVTGNETVSGTLGVTGAVTAASFSGTGSTAAPHPNGATVAGTLAVTGNETVSGTLGVTGALTVGGSSTLTGAVTATGTLTANELDSVNDTNVGGSLFVNGGGTYLQGMSSSNGGVDIVAPLTAASGLTMSGAGNNLIVGGTASIGGAASITGAASIGGTLSGASSGVLTIGSAGMNSPSSTSVLFPNGAKGAGGYPFLRTVDVNLSNYAALAGATFTGPLNAEQTIVALPPPSSISIGGVEMDSAYVHQGYMTNNYWSPPRYTSGLVKLIDISVANVTTATVAATSTVGYVMGNVGGAGANAYIVAMEQSNSTKRDVLTPVTSVNLLTRFTNTTPAYTVGRYTTVPGHVGYIPATGGTQTAFLYSSPTYAGTTNECAIVLQMKATFGFVGAAVIWKLDMCDSAQGSVGMSNSLQLSRTTTGFQLTTLNTGYSASGNINTLTSDTVVTVYASLNSGDIRLYIDGVLAPITNAADSSWIGLHAYLGAANTYAVVQFQSSVGNTYTSCNVDVYPLRHRYPDFLTTNLPPASAITLGGTALSLLLKPNIRSLSGLSNAGAAWGNAIKWTTDTTVCGTPLLTYTSSDGRLTNNNSFGVYAVVTVHINPNLAVNQRSWVEYGGSIAYGSGIGTQTYPTSNDYWQINDTRQLVFNPGQYATVTAFPTVPGASSPLLSTEHII